MRITRKIRPAADVSEDRDQDTESPSIVRLGTIAELVHGQFGNTWRDTSNRGWWTPS